MTTRDKRITVSLDDETLAILDRWANNWHEGNRSRMLRDMLHQFDAAEIQTPKVAKSCPPS